MSFPALRLVPVVSAAALLCAALRPCAAAAAAEPAVSVQDPGAGEVGGAPRPSPSGLGVHVAGAVTHFSYEEFDDGGALLDREHGVIPGVVVGASWRPGAWEVTGEFSYFGQVVDYEGKTNTGLPITTETAEEMVNGALRIWRWFGLFGREVAPFAGLGYHAWDRTIRPTRTETGTRVSGLYETYRWWTAEAGVKILVVPADRLRVWFDARALRVLWATVDVEFPNGLDGASLELGDRMGYRLGVPASLALAPSTELQLDLFYERWAFGRSRDEELTRGGARVGTVHEPRSETRNLGMTVGVCRRF